MKKVAFPVVPALNFVVPAKAEFSVIPAKAGIQVFKNQNPGSRLRGNDEVGALA
jgi:hypothetical protein